MTKIELDTGVEDFIEQFDCLANGKPQSIQEIIYNAMGFCLREYLINLREIDKCNTAKKINLNLPKSNFTKLIEEDMENPFADMVEDKT